jgi:hypothetical protein
VNRCYWCNGSDMLQELRPYGPGGVLVCHGCVTSPAHPERQAAAQAMYEAEQHKAEEDRRARLLASPPPALLRTYQPPG